jgi:Xaa-Pro aminopeptidase
VCEVLYGVELFPKSTVAEYLRANAPKGAVIGYDPALHTLSAFNQHRAGTGENGHELKPRKTNPIDRIWKKRPREKHAPLFLQDEAYAGESAAAKLARLRKVLEDKEADGLLVCAPDAVAWLFNIRGHDVVHTPVALVRAFVPREGKPVIYVSEGHVTPGNRAAIEAMAQPVPLRPMAKDLRSRLEPGAKILADPGYATLQIADSLRKAKARIVEASDPCILFKAKKNETELNGARAAQLRDGVALCRFLAWLDATVPGGSLDEISASDKLEAFRRESALFEELSFDTISGAGPNGAIVHYRATPATNRVLVPGTLYLIDSGAQYRDGTTDVTRTVALGEPDDEMRRHYTLVLKGHIEIAAARFPPGTRGADIDAFARRPLWEAGLDYGHGTGHGVGSFLSVHEGPQSISRYGMIALEPGMLVSNEPGYYREGYYGIRIENLLAVNAAQEAEGGEVPMMSFETLTLAPFDRRLIMPELLSPGERQWVDAYHARVNGEISPALDARERRWLKATAAPL